jgi:hypothetical protein
MNTNTKEEYKLTSNIFEEYVHFLLRKKLMCDVLLVPLLFSLLSTGNE